jgi:hypothetical protein
MIAIAILSAVNAYLFTNMEHKNAFRATVGSPVHVQVESDVKSEWTIYGTMGCGWTRKQLDYMKQSGKSFTFVDCDEGECPDVEGFPTMIHSSGERVVGYKEV